ncbi:MAG: BamA/TamA family outer membrane protein [Bacteroidales bacterium]|nr:BamA/TamA family outer membrane protein [Bacteroidales bacterium]
MAQTRHTAMRILATVLLATAFVSCSVDRYLEPGQLLLNNVDLDVRMADSSAATKEVKEALSNANHYLLQRPNTRFLGVRVSMWEYCMAHPDRDYFFSRYLRRQGSPPVAYDENKTLRSAQQLQSLLNSKGCFGSTVTFDTVRKGKRDVMVTYVVRATSRSRIGDVTYSSDTPELLPMLQKWGETSSLKPGNYYDQEELNNARSRLTDKLHDEGYFLADKSLVTFFVDSTYDRENLGVEVRLANPKIYDSQTKETYTVPLRKYYISNIYVLPNSGSDTEPYDTVVVPTTVTNRLAYYRFLHSGPLVVSPSTISRNMLLFEGMRYKPEAITSTYNALRNLQNFRYINIELLPSPLSTDTLPLLDARVRLINSMRRSLAFSLEVNNSSSLTSKEGVLQSGNFGIETGVEYKNKNLFGGAEQFRVQLSLLQELPKLVFNRNAEVSAFTDLFNAFEVGLDASLNIPKFLLPFSDGIAWQRVRPHTLVSLGGSYQYRSYLTRMYANNSFGYTWSRTRTRSHQLLPVELTFVRFLDIADDFLSRLPNLGDARILYLYSDHFILDARYDYVYNTQQFNTRQNFSFFHLSLENAGLMLNQASRLFNAPVDDLGTRKIYGVPFSQYVRMSSEYKRYWYFGDGQTFVLRGILGVGLPYGNSHAMPFEKGFYGGGPSNIRGWQLRHLGPGVFNSENAQYEYERVGDMTLVSNAEYRFPLGKSHFEGALFMDAGNVWLLKPSSEFPGGDLTLQHFLQGIAWCWGVGLRYNFSFLTFRIDVGDQIYNPGFEQGKRWRIAAKSRSDVEVNFGISYPF